MRLALLALAVLLAGCGEPEQAAPGQASKTYVHAMDGAPASLDPAQASSIYANFLVVNLYDTLYRYKYLARPFELAPNLAAALPAVSDDGLTYTIAIKPGVFFSDDPAFADGRGREVMAGDFVYSLLRHFDPDTRAQGAWLWQGKIAGLEQWKADGADYDRPPEGLRALDSHTVQIQLTRPFPQFVHTLAQGYAAVVPREAVELYGRQLGTRPVGSGPFQLTALNSARAELQRNPGYREERVDLAFEGYQPASQGHLGLEQLQGARVPLLDRVVVEFIAEDAARWNAFISGQTQFIRVPAAQFSQVLEERDPPRLAPALAEDFQLDAAMESGFVYTTFNMDDPAIGVHPDPQQNEANRALRCAIVKGFDWASRNERFFSGLGTVFAGVIPPLTDEFDPATRPDYVVHDPEGARALLQQHGWTAENLPVLEYGLPSSVTERQMFEQFRGFMQDIGYPADKIQPLTFATFGDYARAFSQREVMLVTSSWTLDYPDAENTLALFYGPNASPGSNASNFDDPEFNRLYQQASVMPPSAERSALFAQMNERVMAECVAISGLSRKLVHLWPRSTIMLPDRSFTGGYFLRFVDIADPRQQ
jgi:ABC-type transport system substrate-binding protein